MKLKSTVFMAFVALAWSGMHAQLVKAPRYTSTVDAPAPAAANLPALPAAISKGGTVVEDIVVRVNDQIISRSDVQRSEELLASESAQQNLSPAERAQRQKDMLRDMIDQQLLLSKAKELGLNADAEVVRRLDDIRKQNKMASLDDLEKAARTQGVSFEDFKAQIRNQILQQQVVRDEVGRRLQLSQAEEQKYYDAHKSEFEQPEQVRLSEILVPLPETATAEQVRQAETKANGIKTQVMQNGDFAELAKKFSGGPTAAQGGELGEFKRGALAKVLEDQTFSLKPGESTQPIRTRQGYVILKVTGHDLAGPAPMKEVEPQIQEAIYMQQMQPALRAYLTKLRGESFVDVQPGFVDSGSTGNESKPVFTAYAPPAVKKKKAQNKGRFERGGRYSAAVKAPVVASPDTTGGRTLTGADATPAIDTKTGLATLNAPAKPGKGKKVSREKIRFGQAPRNSLGGDATEAATTSGGASTGGASATTLGAPATETASMSVNLADNPLTPVAPEEKKTRFAARAKEVKEKKIAIANAKQQEKVLATAAPASADETATKAAQAAPLGVTGQDQAKKAKKPKRAKGTPKERLSEKPKAEPVAAPVVAPTANPQLAPTGDLAPSASAPNATPVTAER